MLYKCEIGPDGGKALAAALSEGTAVLTISTSHRIIWPTLHINPSGLDDSNEVGATVTYQGREMTVSQGIDDDGELTLADYSVYMHAGG